MTISTRSAVFLLTLGCLVAATGSASAQFVLREDVHVPPGVTAEFESASKARTARMAEGGVSFSRLAAANESRSHYRFQTILDDSFASVGTWRQEIADMPAGTNSRGVTDLIESIDRSVWQARPDLSYIPDTLRVAAGEIGVVREVVLYPKFGLTQQVAELLREIRGLYRQHGIAGRRVVRELVLGAKGPAFTIVFLARDGQDLDADLEKTGTALGSDLQGLIGRVNRLCRDVEIGNYTNRSDLGYQPGN